jgi:hypothetical protein
VLLLLLLCFLRMALLLLVVLKQLHQDNASICAAAKWCC